MAVFGFQFVYTAILSVVLQKIIPIFSPGLKLLTGYYRFIVPSDDDLKKYTSNSNKNSKDLRIPNDVEIELQMHQTNRNDVAFLPFFSDFTWLVDFCLMAVLCFVGTEAYFQLGFGEGTLLHMGLIWVLIVFYLTVSILLSMIKSYMQSKSGELSVVLSLSSFALVLSMLFLITDKYFDFGLNEAFKSFDKNLKEFYINVSGPNEKEMLESYQGPSTMIFNGYLAFSSTFLACLLTFPGLKSAQMFSLLFRRNSVFDQVLACLNFSLPFVVTVLYMNPVKSFYLDPDHFTLRPDDFVKKSVDPEILAGYENSFKFYRAILILALCLVRLLSFKVYMQEFLVTPKKELDELRKEVGYTKVAKIQEEVKKINLSTCITAVQYITPTVVVGFLALFLVGASDIRMLPNYKGTDTFVGSLIDIETLQFERESFWTKITEKLLGESASTVTSTFVTGVSLKALIKIFNPVLLNGLVNYLLWFTCFYLSLCSFFGYHFYNKKYSAPDAEKKSNLSTKKVTLPTDRPRNAKKAKRH